MEYVFIGIGVCVGIVLLGFILVSLFRPSLEIQRRGMEKMQERLESNQRELDGMKSEVQKHLLSVVEKVDTRLNEAHKIIQSANASLGERLDQHYQTSVGTMQRVQKGLTEVGEATKQIMEVGRNMSALEDLLKPPKLRGRIGEIMLEGLLEEILPKEHFKTQYTYPRSGVCVDAAICLEDYFIPIDSKFPLESFRELAAIEEESLRVPAKKKFIRAVKGHIDSIAEKYIKTDENSSGFAMMYIPAESVFYEMIVRDETAEGAESLQNYALRKKIVPVSPHSLYAYLMVIVRGLRGMQVEKNAERILASLHSASKDLDSIRGDLTILGGHLKNARAKFEDVEKKFEDFDHKLTRTTTDEETMEE